jgi:hypothetical protein
MSATRASSLLFLDFLIRRYPLEAYVSRTTVQQGAEVEGRNLVSREPTC